jgi:hypothetical protein
MKKLALALATTAALGFAAPALAADTDMSGTKAQTQAPAGQTTVPSAQTQSQTPSAQTPTPSTQAQTPAAPTNTPTAQANDKSKGKVSAKANTAKMAHQRSTHLARHDRGFKHGHYYAYVKPHHKSVHHSKTMTQH